VCRPEIKNPRLSILCQMNGRSSSISFSYQRKKTRIMQIHGNTVPEYFPLSKNLLFTEIGLMKMMSSVILRDFSSIRSSKCFMNSCISLEFKVSHGKGVPWRWGRPIFFMFCVCFPLGWFHVAAFYHGKRKNNHSSCLCHSEF